MYCIQQMIKGENLRNWLKNAKTAKVFPFVTFAVYGKCFQGVGQGVIFKNTPYILVI